MNTVYWIWILVVGMAAMTMVLPRDGQPLTRWLLWIAVGIYALALAGCCHTPHDDGCTDERPQALTVPLTLRAVGPDGWAAQLASTVADIEFGIGAVSVACRTPHFTVVDGPAADLDVELVDHTTCAVEGSTAGELCRSQVDCPTLVLVGVVADVSDHWKVSPLRGQVAHELGHLIGLGHADPGRGESAMTVPPGDQLYARDVAAIACKLGCGSCDPTADPYNR